jgi:hypothetical protein
MRVGRHHQALAGRQLGQARAVVALAQELVVEGAGEQFVDQLRADAALWDRLSTEGLRTVREGHSIRVVGDAVMSGLHRTLRLQRTRRA